MAHKQNKSNHSEPSTSTMCGEGQSQERVASTPVDALVLTEVSGMRGLINVQPFDMDRCPWVRAALPTCKIHVIYVSCLQSRASSLY